MTSKHLVRRVPRRIPWCAAVTLACVTAILTLQTAVASAIEAADTARDRLTLVVPATPTGGWGFTAQAMKRVLEAEGIVREVNIQYDPGDGGLAGLAKFASSRHGDGRSLLIAGMAMVGAAVARHDTSVLNDVLPVAQLTSDADVVVVPASSPFHTLDDLLAAMRSNPGAIHWAGGPIGGSGHPTIWQLARAAGVEPELMPYASFPSEHELATDLVSGRLSVAIDGYSEFDSLIRRGELRGLAIISRQPLDGVEIPTFRQLGIATVSIANWCGAFAPPGIGDSDAVNLQNILERMVHSQQWARALKQLHLRGTHLGTADFSQLVHEEQMRIAKADAAASAARGLRLPAELWRHRVEGGLLLLAALIALLTLLRSQKLAARARENDLRLALREMSQKLEQRALEDSPQAQIEREFDRWGLTSAERSVAQLMLKGLRLKEIAGARNTSDRTVRQQAQAIYRKAGLDGRTDLAAYFLESVLSTLAVTPAAGVSPQGSIRAPTAKLRVAKPTAARRPLLPLTALAAVRPP